MPLSIQVCQSNIASYMKIVSGRLIIVPLIISYTLFMHCMIIIIGKEWRNEW